MLPRENETQISEGLIRYHLFDGRVVVFEPLDVNRETVDAWFDNVLETSQNWSVDTPYMEMHDMRQSHITPYNRAKATELVKVMGDDLRGYSAIVVSPSGFSTVIGFFVNAVLGRVGRNLQRRVFHSYDEAIAWFQEILYTITEEGN